MTGSKPVALPLGDTPLYFRSFVSSLIIQLHTRMPKITAPLMNRNYKILWYEEPDSLQYHLLSVVLVPATIRKIPSPEGECTLLSINASVKWGNYQFIIVHWRTETITVVPSLLARIRPGKSTPSIRLYRLYSTIQPSCSNFSSKPLSFKA